MAGIVTPLVYSGQGPQSVADVDWAHPLAPKQGFIVAQHGAATVLHWRGGKQVLAIAGKIYDQGARGFGAQSVSTGTTALTLPTFGGSGTDGATALWRAGHFGSVTVSHRIYDYDAGVGGVSLALYTNVASNWHWGFRGSSGGTNQWSLPTSSPTARDVIAFVNDGTNSGTQGYINGAPVTTSVVLGPTGGTPLGLSGVSNFYLANRADGTRGWLGPIEFIYYDQCKRSASDVAELSKNIWQIFKPIVVPVKTASSGVSIDCTVGNATAAGIQATIQSPISLSCSVGDAVAAGVQATIQSPISVDCSAGNATAAGVSATITVAQSIDCTPGNAVAAGIQASIDEVAGDTTINCTPGDATAAGVQASIDFVPLGESSPSYGGGGGAFRAQRSREFNRFIQGLFEEPKKKPLKQKLAQIVEDAKSEEKLQVAISSLQAAFDSKQARENAELALEVETTLRKLQTRLKELEEEEGFVVSNLLL